MVHGLRIVVFRERTYHNQEGQSSGFVAVSIRFSCLQRFSHSVNQLKEWHIGEFYRSHSAGRSPPNQRGLQYLRDKKEFVRIREDEESVSDSVASIWSDSEFWLMLVDRFSRNFPIF
jgi:hypothetical protein